MDGCDHCGGCARWGLALAAGLVAGCSQSEAPDDSPARAPEVAQVKAAAQALAGAHVATLDPAPLNDAEIAKVIGGRANCTFYYTRSGRPVLAASLAANGAPAAGLVKLNNSLVPLQGGAAAIDGGFVWVAAPLRLTVHRLQQPDAAATHQRVPAEMVFAVGHELKVGYDGFADCPPAASNPVAGS